MSKHILYFLVINSLIAFLLAWHTYSRFNDYKEHHIALANESVNSLSYEISNFIKERRRLVALFAREHKNLITQLIQQPDSDDLKETVRNKLFEYFPEAFTFTVANNTGVPYLVDFDGKVGELCVSDIKSFSSSKLNEPQIHPGVDAYHFDIMADLKTDIGNVIFFVSFHADILGHIIKTIEIPNHILELILKNDRPLLEVTKHGARNNTPRNDFRLTEKETGMILASKAVANSRWYAIDSHTPDLFNNFLQRNLTENSIFLLFSLVITAFFNYLIKKEERLRIIAENSRNDFLSIVSHELRTPLTSIYGAVNLLADKNIKVDKEKSQQMLDITKRNTSQLLHLINEILDFRKIESGNVEYHFEPVELNTLIKEAIEGMNDYAHQYGATIVYSGNNQPINILADKTRILQVANNLISNAIKYGASNDTITVEVGLSDSHAQVSVHDNGPGIPEEFKNKIFEKFSQANIKNKTTGSTGLGLNIAKTFIEAHQGEINFTSSPQGTTFYFTLPIEA